MLPNCLRSFLKDDTGKFMVTSARNLVDANPDVYFDEINVQLNSSSVVINEDIPVTTMRKPDAAGRCEYCGSSVN